MSRILDLLVLQCKHMVYLINTWTDVFWMHYTVFALYVPVQKLLRENERGKLKVTGKMIAFPSSKI